jgi:hypothetical protein
MKYAEGNDKLGKNCLVVSRPVGDTCPPDCAFLDNGCYAENTEKIYPGVRPAGMQNLITEKNRIRSMILEAKRRNRSIRFMERGDWLLNGELDISFVENVVWACDSILADGDTLPKMWFYTHVYDERIPAQLGKYFSIFASIHNGEHMKIAKSKGFTKFAWCDSDQKIAPKRPKYKAKADAWRQALPKLVILEGEKFITCPEIRRGRSFVTCTGTKDSQACNMCLDKDKPNVLFPCH